MSQPHPNHPTCQSCDAPATILAGVVGPEWVPVCEGHFEFPALWWADHDPKLDGPIVPSYRLVPIYN